MGKEIRDKGNRLAKTDKAATDSLRDCGLYNSESGVKSMARDGDERLLGCDKEDGLKFKTTEI